MYEAFLEFPEGWGGVKKNPFHGRGTCMDIFWKYTMGAAKKNAGHSGRQFLPANR